MALSTFSFNDTISRNVSILNTNDLLRQKYKGCNYESFFGTLHKHLPHKTYVYLKRLTPSYNSVIFFILFNHSLKM